MSDQSLTAKKCQPCEGMGAPLSAESVKPFLEQTPSWILSDDGLSISRDYLTKNFMAAVAFIQKIADVAESEDHHPDIHLVGCVFGVF